MPYKLSKNTCESFEIGNNWYINPEENPDKCTN